jgi:hypothetical protein
MAALTIDIPPELDRQLKEAAQNDGLPVDEFVVHALESLFPGTGASAKPFWQRIVESAQRIPEEELANVPTDLSENLDHYLYGAPKHKP